jgi:hypothetical protein
MTCTGGGSCVQSPTDCPGNFLLCDGFESGSLDTTTKWQPPNCAPGTTLTVDTNQHHWGNYALHVQFGAVSSQAYDWCWTKTQQMSIFSSTPMYFRAWVFYAQLPGADSETLIDLASSANGNSASGGIGIDKPGTYYIGQANSGFDYKTPSTVAITLGAWNCIELEVDTSPPNGQMLGWDSNSSSTPDPALHGNANLASLLSARFGLDFNGPTIAFDMYMDDIAISNSYIPCNQ